jgi:ADP-ribosylglycohydrolase
MVDRDRFLGLMLGLFAADSVIRNTNLDSKKLWWSGNPTRAPLQPENAVQALLVLKSIRRRNFLNITVLSANLKRNPLESSADALYSGSIGFQRVHLADRRQIGLPDKVTKEDCSEYRCGTILRCAPLAALELEMSQLMKVSADQSMLTHKNTEAVFADQCFVMTLKHLLDGRSPEEVLELLMTALCHSSSPFAQDQTFSSMESDPPMEHKSSIRSLVNGVFSLKRDSDFKSAILRLKTQPGNPVLDAPITGALWGAEKGSSQIPKDWLLRVECRDEIIQEIDRIEAADLKVG